MRRNKPRVLYEAMSDLICRQPTLPAMSFQAVAAVARLAEACKPLPQIPLVTQHLFHAGMYSRTIILPKNTALTGVLIKRSTVVTIAGDVSVFAGGEAFRVTGYKVIPASANRKQAYLSFAETAITMCFATSAKTVEEAEMEFTDEFSELLSHSFDNEVIFTGE